MRQVYNDYLSKKIEKLNFMRYEFLIFDLVSKRYYARFPDVFSLDVLDATGFDSIEEAERRIEEILCLGQQLTIIKYWYLGNG